MKRAWVDLGGNLCRHLDSGSVFTGPAGGAGGEPLPPEPVQTAPADRTEGRSDGPQWRQSGRNDALQVLMSDGTGWSRSRWMTIWQE